MHRRAATAVVVVALREPRRGAAPRRPPGPRPARTSRSSAARRASAAPGIVVGLSGAATHAHVDLTGPVPSYLKRGASVLRGHRVTMKIAQTGTTGSIGMPESGGGDGLAASKASVTLIACGRHQRTSRAIDGRAVTFWSGGFSKPSAPAPVPVDVYVDHSRHARRGRAVQRRALFVRALTSSISRKHDRTAGDMLAAGALHHPRRRSSDRRDPIVAFPVAASCRGRRRRLADRHRRAVGRRRAGARDSSANAHFDGLGIAPGRVKHVWLIIMENKSFDASFTGLNNNTFLWQTLPSQGVLLENGTGHFSQDNYISMVAGQARSPTRSPTARSTPSARPARSARRAA